MPTQVGSYDFKAAKKARDSIEVGGRNYVSALAENWVQKTVSESSAAGTSWANIQSASESTTRISTKNLIPVSGSSIAVSAASGYDIFVTFFDTNGYMRSYLTWSNRRVIDLSGYSGCTHVGLTVRKSDNSTITQSEAVNAKVKLEAGNKPTDWTPAPEDVAQASDSVEYIVGTQTATTNAWTGVTKDAAIYAGKKIAYYLPYAGNSSAATLNLTLSGGGTTGAKNVRWNNTNITTHYPQYSVIMLVYDGTYWRTSAYNSDTTNRKRIENNVKVCDENMPKYCIAGHVTKSTAANSGYKMLASGVVIDLQFPIAYLNANVVSGQSYAVAANGTTTNFYTAMNSVTLSNTKSGWTGTQYAMCYIKGTVMGSKLTVHSDVFTTTEPTTEDGYAYIPIGMTYSTTAVNFDCDNTIYVYKCGKFGQASIQEAEDAALKATAYITDIANDGVWVHPENYGPNSSGQAVSTTYGWHISDAIELFRAGVSYIKMWVENSVAKLRLGRSDQGHVIIDEDGLDAYNSDGVTVARFGTDGAEIGILENGMTAIGPSGFTMFMGGGKKVYEIAGAVTSAQQSVTHNSGFVQMVTATSGTPFVDDYGLTYVGNVGRWTKLPANGADDASFRPYHSQTPISGDPYTASSYDYAPDSPVVVWQATKGAYSFDVYGYVDGGYITKIGIDLDSSNMQSIFGGSSPGLEIWWDTTETVYTLAELPKMRFFDGQGEQDSNVVAEFGEKCRITPRGHGNSGLFISGDSGSSRVGLALTSGVGDVASGVAKKFSIAAGDPLSYATYTASGGAVSGAVAKSRTPTASGISSAAIGTGAVAEGDSSIAIGKGVTARADGQLAIGKHNVIDTNDQYALIIGNGHVMDSTEIDAMAEEIGSGSFDSEVKSNALTIDWDGKERTVGAYYVDASHIDRDGSNPSETLYKTPYVIYDKDGERLAGISVARMTDGKTRAGLYAWNEDSNGNEVSNALHATVAKDGTCSYSVTDSAAFCSAINVGDTVTKDVSSAVSVAKSTWANIADVVLAAGTWVVTGNVQFASNATGRRIIAFTTASSPSATDNRQHRVEVGAASGAETRLNLSCTKTFSSQTTLHFKAYQNSGSSLSTTGYVSAVRIK